MHFMKIQISERCAEHTASVCIDTHAQVVAPVAFNVCHHARILNMQNENPLFDSIVTSVPEYYRIHFPPHESSLYPGGAYRKLSFSCCSFFSSSGL